MVSFPEDGSIRSSSLSGGRSHRSHSITSNSVASSSRTSLSTVRRHHRHPSRSHAESGGGARSSLVRNEFPSFLQTGDVEIILKDRSGVREQRYVLHRLYLAQNSGFFETNTVEMWDQEEPAARTAANVVPGRPLDNSMRRWRFELQWTSSADGVPMLVKTPLSSMPTLPGDEFSRPPLLGSRPSPPSRGLFRNNPNFTALDLTKQTKALAEDPEREVFQTYDNLFRIFYNFPPQLDNLQIAEAYVQSKALLQLADMYDALHVIGPRIDHHLLCFHGKLWRQIAKYPPSYLKLGYLARSKAIFSEALIHVVGQWPAGHHQLRDQVPSAVIEVIEDKVDELEEIKARVEAKLWRLTLTTSRGERVTPHNSWLDWQVINLWRQWFAEETTSQPTGILKSPGGNLSSHHRNTSRSTSRSGSGARSSSQSTALRITRGPQAPLLNTGRVFWQIGKGCSGYLNRDEVKRFLKISPELYSRDNLRRAERRLEELKNLASDAVTPLMRNFLQLDSRGDSLPYLVCTKMEERDWQLVFDS